MVVISEPLNELVGGGKNAKHIKECTELYLGSKGIEKIRGFEPFTNLEVLWLNDNKLKKVNNLDANFRIRVLCAQNNQICTLKGSLTTFRYLEHLDLSNNQLRDLAKILKVLTKFDSLKHLNLKDNPCCEEPSYRLITIFTLTKLVVLDQHVVTPAERAQAAVEVGPSGAAQKVVFGVHAPPVDAAWGEKVAERSALEQTLGKDAATIRTKRADLAFTSERALFGADPYTDLVTRGASLPPNAGTVRAMQTWSERAAQSSADGALLRAPRSPRVAAPDGSAAAPGQGADEAPKDVLVLYSCRPSIDAEELRARSKLTRPVPAIKGSIKFEREKFEQHLHLKATGTLGGWELTRTEVGI